jgi:hypothetical protein
MRRSFKTSCDMFDLGFMNIYVIGDIGPCNLLKFKFSSAFSSFHDSFLPLLTLQQNIYAIWTTETSIAFQRTTRH